MPALDQAVDELLFLLFPLIERFWVVMWSGEPGPFRYRITQNLVNTSEPGTPEPNIFTVQRLVDA